MDAKRAHIYRLNVEKYEIYLVNLITFEFAFASHLSPKIVLSSSLKTFSRVSAFFVVVVKIW